MYRLISMYFVAAWATLLAQDHIVFLRQEELTFRVEHRADTLYGETQKKFSKAVFDPRAQTLLNSAGKVTQAIFHLPSLHLQRAITYQNGKDDDMLVEWSFDEPYGQGRVLLQDTPFMSEYFLRVSGCACGTREELGRFLTALVVLGQSPVLMPALEVRLPVNYPALGGFYGSPPPLYSEVAVIRNFEFAGWFTGRDLYLHIGVGKLHTREYYPVAPYIPERFPPLPDLVSKWSTEELWADLARPLGGGRFTFLSENRDSVLAGELLRRGLSDSDFLKLLTNVPPHELYGRAQVVFEVLQKTGQDGAFVHHLELALQAYQRIGAGAKNAVMEMFHSQWRQTGCSPVLEGSALRLLRERMFLDVALEHLGECAKSAEAFNEIKNTPVPSELQSKKEFALRQISRRLGK